MNCEAVMPDETMHFFMLWELKKRCTKESCQGRPLSLKPTLALNFRMGHSVMMAHGPWPFGHAIDTESQRNSTKRT